ncbi:hypothetical protein RFM68_32135 [Mesorhizobium sp. MSK_1335]|uniref:PNPLA domain-containing protein n=1 Tax=Mesorhizobium montanum TaxID=3072323 RepID=A0ABU4ZUM2_9HYPH|nr:hypothetical protein [Mesorhizobium sp. MSK_1335]MDX8529111.1 hypothetical protein [Mesorhizobium sp. MSK_1335]
MHVQSTGAVAQQAIISGATHELEERRPVDVVLASDVHGAFAWGVLDRLLDEQGFVFDTITASGFAAVEAAVLVYGLGLGGRRGARTALANFWRRVSHASMLAADRTDLLRSILEQSIDIEQIRTGRCPVKLCILAVNSRTDALKIFTGSQLSIDAIVAAAAVPFLLPAVEIGGDSYWGDGDVSALPAAPSVEACHRLIVAGQPRTCATSCTGRQPGADCSMTCTQARTIIDVRHRAGAALLLRPWVDWGELTDMRDRGRQSAGDWLLIHLPDIKQRPAVDCKTRYI